MKEAAIIMLQTLGTSVQKSKSLNKSVNKNKYYNYSGHFQLPSTESLPPSRARKPRRLSIIYLRQQGHNSGLPPSNSHPRLYLLNTHPLSLDLLFVFKTNASKQTSPSKCTVHFVSNVLNIQLLNVSVCYILQFVHLFKCFYVITTYCYLVGYYLLSTVFFFFCDSNFPDFTNLKM
jgi:hypothetical protein